MYCSSLLEPITPTGPWHLLNVSLGIILALMASVGVAVFREQRNFGELLYPLFWPAPPAQPAAAKSTSQCNGHHDQDLPNDPVEFLREGLCRFGAVQ